MNSENVQFVRGTGGARACPELVEGSPVPPQAWVVAQFRGDVGNCGHGKAQSSILKRVSNIPSLGICESCHTQFSADPRQLGQAGVQQQLNAHKCEARQNAVPSTKDA